MCLLRRRHGRRRRVLQPLRKIKGLTLTPSFHREPPDPLKEAVSSLELDDEFPQKHADGAFSANAMTNDIGRADNRTCPPESHASELRSDLDLRMTESGIVVTSTRSH
jgi:hypothetical protein